MIGDPDRQVLVLSLPVQVYALTAFGTRGFLQICAGGVGSGFNQAPEPAVEILLRLAAFLVEVLGGLFVGEGFRLAFVGLLFGVAAAGYRLRCPRPSYLSAFS